MGGVVEVEAAVAGSGDAGQPRRARHLEQCGVGVPPLQQRQGVADPGAVGHATTGGAVHADLCRVHISEGPSGAGRSDGISDRAFSTFEPAARAHATLADVNAGAIQAQARSGVVYYVDASYFIFRAYHSMPSDMVDGDGNATHALYGFARFLSDLVEQVRP